MLSGVFGLGVILADIGLVGFGALALRQRSRSHTWAALPLVLGVFPLIVVTPISLAGVVAANGVAGVGERSSPVGY